MSKPSVYGNVVEYIADRLYWASYTSPPSSSTPFPPVGIPDPYKQQASAAVVPGRSPVKRSKNENKIVNSSGLRPVYFTVDDALLYNAFHHDFGPLHIGHLYRFAVTLHDILGDPRNEKRVVVFWSKPNAKARANAGCLLACYMVLVQSWPPHLALSPLSHCDPPLMPFRDAGYSQADFILNVQDVVYGVWKAKEKGLVNLREFALEEYTIPFGRNRILLTRRRYERFERVDMGDFNWVSPNFLAFASPQFELPKAGLPQPHIPTDLDELADADIPTPFKNVLEHFYMRDIGLVVRLNSHLYPAQYFTELGITHLDMIFDDGTCPPLNLVRKFVNLAHHTIMVDKKNIAVHCKAGLGRTGCLIGAYLIYRYGFTANEVIAYMRFMRPGMVVGPQQHWLHLNQGDFRQWWFEDTILAAALEKQAIANGGLRTPTKGKRISSTSTPTRRSVLGEVDHNESATSAALPAPTPGQPRKTSSRYPGTAKKATEVTKETLISIADENETAPSPSRRRKSGHKVIIDEDEMARAIQAGMTEEEYLIRMTKRASRSPTGKRITSSSYTTPSTTVRQETVTPPEKQTRPVSSISAIKARSSPRRHAVAAGGVRKVSGRNVSGGAPTPGRAL